MGLKDRLYNRQNPELQQVNDNYIVRKEPEVDVQEQYEEQQTTEHFSQSSPKEDNTSPLAILEEIKNWPAPKGAYPTIIGGRPVDLHELEDYLLKISPHNIKTVMRYHNARVIEEMRRYAGTKGKKFDMKTLMLIMLAAGMGILGIILLLYWPQILAGMKGLFGGI